MKFISVVIAFAALNIMSTCAFSLDLSVRGEAAKKATAAAAAPVAPAAPKTRDIYKRNRIMQAMGMSMIGASAVMILAGASVVEAAPWGSLSRLGIAFIGTGLVHFVTSAFLLGFSRPTVIQELPPVRPLRIIKKSAFHFAPNGDIYF